MNSVFNLLTPALYLVLICLWCGILFFYLKRLFKPTLTHKVFSTLFIVLALDAFRTMFESLYFGLREIAFSGFLPLSVYHYLRLPGNVFVPKFLNFIVAVLIVFILIKKWLPQEEAELSKEQRYMLELEDEIARRQKVQEKNEALIAELQELNQKMQTLRGLIPICASCKKIRDDNGFWNQIETYIREHADVVFSHSLCPDCVKDRYPRFYQEAVGSNGVDL